MTTARRPGGGRRRLPGLLPTLLGAALLGAAPAAPAGAASLEVAPISTEFQPGQMAAVLTVTNRGDARAGVQVRAFRWTQPGGRDLLAPTQELLVSPPLFEMAPGASQAVRLVLRRAAEAPESAYRLLLDEIPAAASGTQSVRLSLRLSLPVFARATPGGASELEWRWAGDRVVVANRGTRRAQMANLSVAGGAALRGPEIPYVLAGAEREWQLPSPPPRGRPLRLTGVGENGAFSVEVPARP